MYGPDKNARWPEVDILPSKMGTNLKLLWTIPFVTLVTLITVASLTLLPLVAISDLFRKSSWGGCRTLLFLAYFLSFELFMLIIVMASIPVVMLLPRWRRARFSWNMQRLWTRSVSRGLLGLYGLDMSIEGLEELKDEPFVLLIKHTSMADTTLPLYLFSVKRGTHLRYVLKEEMLNDPLFNLVGRFFPNIFVKRGSGDAEAQYRRIEELSVGLNRGDGIVIFPEGTRFSKEKLDRVKTKLEKSELPILKEHASSVQNVLPLRTGGALALMKNSGDAKIIICGHVGFEGSRTMRNLWNGALIGQSIKVKFWVHDIQNIPTEPDQKEAWLFEQWEIMDRWVGGQKEAKSA